MAKSEPKKFCSNCIFASKAFKIYNFTHHHCYHPDKEEMQGWETLMQFNDSCEKHERKQKTETQK